jgi:tRNA (adenine22-N1)-methyltransferase
MTTLQPSKRINIGQRLKTVADSAAVRLSSENISKPLCAIDVGTDHAKLPMYLVSECGFSHVTATDINEGPCHTARANISLAGAYFKDRIDVIKTDGLCGLDTLCPDRIIIAGMGGELIVGILSAAEFVRKEKEKIKFVLQPQSKEQILRRYLYENGYRILDEKRCLDAGKYYCVISAVYDGIKREQDLLTLYFGEQGILHPDALFDAVFDKKYKILQNNIKMRALRESEETRDAEQEEKELFLLMSEYKKRREQQ